MAENKQVEVKEVELEVIVTEYTNKEKGNKFNGYHTFVGKNLKKVTLKFRKDVANLPKENGFIKVMSDQVNLDTTSKYPTLWVRSVISFTPKAQRQSQAIDFDNLPF